MLTSKMKVASLKEVIIFAMGHADFSFTHCITVLSNGNNVRILDSMNDNILYFPKDPTGLGHNYNFADELNKYHVFKLYKFEWREVNDQEAAKINRDMNYVMTGEMPNYQEIFQRNALKSNKSKKRRGS